MECAQCDVAEVVVIESDGRQLGVVVGIAKQGESIRAFLAR